MSQLELGGASILKDAASGDDRLAEMGYSQELRRSLTSFANFGVSFSAISIITGYASLLGDGLKAGGPAPLVWGWWVVSFFTTCIALAMGEICSRYPHAGGLYFWVARVGSRRMRGYVAWITGWCNLLGQFAIVAASDFGLALLLLSTISIAKDEPAANEPWVVLLVYAGFLTIHGLMNTFAVRWLNGINTVSVYWHVVGTYAIMIACLVGAPKLQSAEWVFTSWENNSGWQGLSGAIYAALLGLLMSQYTLTGYDASAHMTEETVNAEMGAPIGIVSSVVVSALVGWPLLVGLLFSVQDLDRTLNSETGMAIAQIFLDCTGRLGAVLLLIVVMGAMFFSAVAATTTASRTLYAFARDGAVPFSRSFCRVNKKLEAPVAAVWASVGVAMVLGLPYLGSDAAFSAVTSLATVALSLSYGLPAMARLANWDAAHFVPGPFHLYSFSKIVAAIASFWVLVITVLFLLPKEGPEVTAENMNWSSVELVFVIGLASIAWWLGWGKTFLGMMDATEDFHDDVKRPVGGSMETIVGI